MEDTSLDPAPVWDDLTTFDGEPWRGVVDLISAGYPCQPFSLAGKRQGTADPRHLWPHIKRIISEVLPKQVFLENVPGHLSLGFEEVVSDLESLGFCIAQGLFTAEEVGSTHRRERLFILANADGGRLKGIGGSGVFNGVWAALRNNIDGQGCAPMGNPNVSGLEGWGMPERKRRGELPAWPPGPGGQWWGIPEAYWPTEPYVRGMANGSPLRVDRLRALGNGVVPQQAAHAYCFLSEVLGC